MVSFLVMMFLCLDNYLEITSIEKKGLLERMAEGPVIGDGGFIFALEKRGYVKAGPWTPEATVEHPDGVRELHREFLRAGSDIMQAFTYYASEDKLVHRGNKAGQSIGMDAINRAAAGLAKEVAAEGDALTLGGISQTPSYLEGGSKEAVQAVFRNQINVFVREQLDFVLCEYFEHIEETEWAIEVCKESGKPVAATMCIGPEGDLSGVSVRDCAVRMVRAGADVIGVNCHFDPFIALKTVSEMKLALEEANLTAFLMCQPIAFHVPDAGKQGFVDLPEFPFGLEPRICTRWDIHKYAREAYELGVRYIGGCCGFEPYHIRAIAEELSVERGRLPAGSEKHSPWGKGLEMHTKPWVRARGNKEFWQNLKPASGRPLNPSMSEPEGGKLNIKQERASTKN